MITQVLLPNRNLSTIPQVIITMAEEIRMVLTYNVDSSYLTDHRITVDLTHVMTGVFRLGPTDVK